jgi:hypothetical protein
MSGIKRYNALGDIDGGYLKSAADGRVVRYPDHLASHAFDEVVERAAFEAAMLEEGFRTTLEPDLDGVYMSPTAHAMWCGWLRCAKSRAKRFGYTEQAMEPDKLDRPDIGDYAKRTAEDLRRRLERLHNTD